MLLAIIVAVLILVCAALWYGVRTHKSVKALEQKLEIAIAAIADAIEKVKEK